MQRNRKRLLLVLLFVFPTIHISAQEWKQKVSQDSITILYKWEKEKGFKKNSPFVLSLKVKNKRATKVTISFVVLYYWKIKLHSTSKTKMYCLKAGQTIKGKKWNLAFTSDFIVMDKFLDPMFTWEIGRLKVEPNKDCEPGLRLRLQPAYP